MKTAFNTIRKDNAAAATLLAATFITIIGGIVTSNDAHAVKAAPQMEVQRMETIVVNASRYANILLAAN